MNIRSVILIFIVTSYSFFLLSQKTVANYTSIESNLSSKEQQNTFSAEQFYEQGNQQQRKSQYQLATQSYLQALSAYKALGNSDGQGNTLYKLGESYEKLNQLSKAIDYYQQTLTIRQQTNDSKGQGLSLKSLGRVYFQVGEYSEGLQVLEKALVIWKTLNNPIEEGNTLLNIGRIYLVKGNFSQALQSYQQSLEYFKKGGDIEGEGLALTSLAIVYGDVGDYTNALNTYQQALQKIRYFSQGFIEKDNVSKLKDIYRSEGLLLHNIGRLYSQQKLYSKAAEYYEEALVLRQKADDQIGEGRTLNNLGFTYSQLGKFEKAEKILEHALAISRRIGDRSFEAKALDSLATIYQQQKIFEKAFQFYLQALVSKQVLGDRVSERTTLSNLGDLFAEQKQPELAILFYKQSVNVTEAIRKDLRPLPKAQQESYTQTVAETYRKLADLLLQQDRVLEAQQVLELLKVQELDDYLRNVRGVGQQIEFLRPEAEILKRYGKLQETAIQVGRELAELRKKAAQGSLTEAEKKRVAELDQLETSLNEQFGQFIRSEEVKKLIAQLSPEVQEQIVKLSDLEALRDDLRRMNAVMIYPLVLSDRLELIITTPDSIPLRRTVPVKREILNAAILEFRQALQSPSIDAKPVAQKLYKWLIEPLEADLKQATPQTIIYAPDGQLRYIPLAALHDGQQWLVQRYRINNITAKSLTKFNNPSNVQMRVLAGAFADAHITYPVKVGERNFSFKGLPFAGQEVTHLAALFPGTSKVLDRAFSLSSVKPVMNGFSVVHLATHAAFVPGDPSNSFILFGDGSFATLRDIENWSLNNVDLVVLSACETGVGIKDVGDKALGNGEEVLGLGYQFQSRGARAVIASLWSIHDGSTQQFMSIFYSFLKQGNITKAESLQQAQIALITNDFTAGGKLRGNFRIETASNPASISTNLSHPFYWAPFILIGNGL